MRTAIPLWTLMPLHLYLQQWMYISLTNQGFQHWRPLAVPTENMESSGRSLWVSRDSRRNIKEENSIFSKLSNNDNKQLFDLADIVAEIESIMRYPSYVTVFAYYNSSSGANPLVAKLPTNLQERWTTEATKYKSANNVPYPPFSVFFKVYTQYSQSQKWP